METKKNSSSSTSSPSLSSLPSSFSTIAISNEKKEWCISIDGILIPRDVIYYLLVRTVPEELLLWRALCRFLKEIVEEIFKDEKFCSYNGLNVKDSMCQKIALMKEMRKALVTGESPKVKEMKTKFLSRYEPGTAPVSLRIEGEQKEGKRPLLNINPIYQRLIYRNHCGSDLQGKERNFFHSEIDYNIELQPAIKKNGISIFDIVITHYDRENLLLQEFAITEIETLEEESGYYDSKFDMAYEYDEFILIQHQCKNSVKKRMVVIVDKKELLKNKKSIGKAFFLPVAFLDYLCLGNTFYFSMEDKIYSQPIEITKKRNFIELTKEKINNPLLSLKSKTERNSNLPNSPTIFAKIFGSYYIILCSVTKCCTQIFTLEGKLEFTLESPKGIEEKLTFPLITKDYFVLNNTNFNVYFDRIGWEKKEYVLLKTPSLTPCGGLMYFEKIGILGFEPIKDHLEYPTYLFGRSNGKFCFRKAKEIKTANLGCTMFGNNVYCLNDANGQGEIVDYS